MFGLNQAKAVGVAPPARATRAYSATIQLIAGIGCVVAAAPAQAENWRLSASAGAIETYTSNVNYSAQGNADSDFVTSVSAALQVSGGIRFKLNGSIGATGLLYARHSENNTVGLTPNVNLAGTLEAIENFLFVDLRASASPSFLSPFGAQPVDLANATNNRFISQTYGVSPYIRGRIAGTSLSYQLRDDNIWTAASKFGGSSVDAPSTYVNQLSSSVSSPAAPIGWSVDYSRTDYSNGNSTGSTTTNIVHAILSYQIDPQILVSARGGYEDNQIQGSSSRSSVYGAGGHWSPTERTQVDGFWEHRFFGQSYLLQISHRLPRAALSASLSRDLGTFPQLSLTIPAGASVASFVDAAFTTRIPDPVERAIAVARFLAGSGLPPMLAIPVNLYGANTSLRQSANVSLVLIGALNSMTFTLFNVRSEQIAGSETGLSPILQTGQNNTQTGLGVSFSHRLGAQTNLTANAQYARTTLNAAEGAVGGARSNNGNLGLSVGTSLGPKTSGSAGVSYSRSESPGTANAGTANPGTVSSLNVFASVNHTF